MSLKLSELREANVARQNEAYGKLKSTCQDELYLCTAIAGEVGELCNFVKKERRDGVDNSVSINKELADILTYLDLLAEVRGVDLGEATRDKFNEVSDRIGSDVRL